MNNICRMISEYQQSNYQELSAFSCTCGEGGDSEMESREGGGGTATDRKDPSCAIHHGQGHGAGLIHSDGTIYISEVSYVKNYLNSFLYIEELQKFKEDENYRDSLELEPDLPNEKINESTQNQTSATPCKLNSYQSASESISKTVSGQHRKSHSLATNLFCHPNGGAALS